MAKKEENHIELSYKGTSAAQRRFFENAEIEKGAFHLCDSTGHINGQGRFPLSCMRFGRVSAGGTACEIIAVYNVLADLKRPMKLAELIFCAEALGYLFLFGAFGTKISKIGALLEKLGVPFERIKCKDFLKGDFEEGSIFIVTVRNNARLPVSSLHTFEIVKKEGQWLVYNRFNESESSLVYGNLKDILINGNTTAAYYCVYRILSERQ